MAINRDRPAGAVICHLSAPRHRCPHDDPPLLDPGERMGFASRDAAQRQVAEHLGFVAI